MPTVPRNVTSPTELALVLPLPWTEHSPTKAKMLKKKKILKTTINIFSKSFHMLVSLNTESFVLSTLLNFTPKLLQQGGFYQRRKREANGLSAADLRGFPLLHFVVSFSSYYLFPPNRFHCKHILHADQEGQVEERTEEKKIQ